MGGRSTPSGRMPGIMSTSIAAEGLDVDAHGHVIVKLNDAPSEEWTAAFREYWGKGEPVGNTAIKKEAFSHISGRTIVFRGVDVAGFVQHCKRFTEDSIKHVNDLMRRIETERDARIRARTEPAARDKKLEGEQAKAREVKFN